MNGKRFYVAQITAALQQVNGGVPVGNICLVGIAGQRSTAGRTSIAACRRAKTHDVSVFLRCSEMSDTPAAEYRTQLLAFVNACQVAVGAISTPSLQPLASLDWLAGRIPPITEAVSQLEIRLLLANVCLDFGYRFPDALLDTHEFWHAVARLTDFNQVNLEGIFRQALGSLTRSPCRLEDVASVSLDRRIALALEFLDAEFRNPALRLADVAQEIGLSASHFERLLMRETQSGFLHHLHRRRIEQASTLLDTTSLSIKAIAFEVGYKYTSQLDRHFKTIHDMRPSAWRQRPDRTH